MPDPVTTVPRVAVLGAGPTGLEAALAAHQRGWDVTVYEAAPTVAGHVRAWGHVRLFTPWSMNVSPRVQEALGLADLPADVSPTGHEYADHLERVAALLGDRVRTSTRVEAIAREGLLKSEEIGTARRAELPFRLLVTDPDGDERFETADVVLDCTGTYANPAPVGAGGIPAQGERRLASGDVDGVRLVAGVVVERLAPAGDRVAVDLVGRDGNREQVVVDEVVAMTGAVGDSSLYRQLQVHECYATEGPMALAGALMAASGGSADCLAQPALGVDALRNPEPRFFVLGIKSYGRNNTFLLRVGWEQVEEVVTALEAELLVPA